MSKEIEERIHRLEQAYTRNIGSLAEFDTPSQAEARAKAAADAEKAAEKQAAKAAEMWGS